MRALGSLKELYLYRYRNQIGDDGMKASSDAIASGAVPKLAEVFVFGNPGNGTGVKDACSARGIQCTCVRESTGVKTETYVKLEL